VRERFGIIPQRGACGFLPLRSGVRAFRESASADESASTGPRPPDDFPSAY
jgi:hypothetical protein